MVPDSGPMFDLEDAMNWKRETSIFQKKLKPALGHFDFVLVDLPANLKKSSVIGINGLAMADFVVIPVKPAKISLNALPRTFEMIDYVQMIAGDGGPDVLGFIRNSTDRRYQQYKANFPEILSATQQGELPPVFDNVWPPSPAFESATDDSRDVETLKERFGAVYDNARRVARELEFRCADFKTSRKRKPVRRTIWQRLGLG